MIDVYFEAAARLLGFAVKIMGRVFNIAVRLAKEVVISAVNALGNGVRSGYQTLQDSPSTQQDQTRASSPAQERSERRTQQTGSRQNQREHTQESSKQPVDAPFQSSKSQEVGPWYSLLFLAGMNPDGTGIAHVVRTYRDAKTSLAAKAAEPYLIVHKSSGAEPKYGTPVAVRLTDKQQIIQKAQERRIVEAQVNAQRSIQKHQKTQRIGRSQAPPTHSINP